MCNSLADGEASDELAEDSFAFNVQDLWKLRATKQKDGEAFVQLVAWLEAYLFRWLELSGKKGCMKIL